MKETSSEVFFSIGVIGYDDCSQFISLYVFIHMKKMIYVNLKKFDEK